MQSNTARIFGRSALIDLAWLSLEVRLIAGLGEETI
jgi:hypothetical protein